MSSFTDKNKNAEASLDGPNDLKPEVKTSYITQKEAAEAAAAKSESEESDED